MLRRPAAAAADRVHISMSAWRQQSVHATALWCACVLVVLHVHVRVACACLCLHMHADVSARV